MIVLACGVGIGMAGHGCVPDPLHQLPFLRAFRCAKEAVFTQRQGSLPCLIVLFVFWEAAQTSRDSVAMLERSTKSARETPHICSCAFQKTTNTVTHALGMKLNSRKQPATQFGSTKTWMQGRRPPCSEL